MASPREIHPWWWRLYFTKPLPSTILNYEIQNNDRLARTSSWAHLFCKAHLSWCLYWTLKPPEEWERHLVSAGMLTLVCVVTSLIVKEEEVWASWRNCQLGERPCKVPGKAHKLSRVRGEKHRPLADEPGSLRCRCSETSPWPPLQTVPMPSAGSVASEQWVSCHRAGLLGSCRNQFSDEFSLCSGHPALPPLTLTAPSLQQFCSKFYRWFRNHFSRPVRNNLAD